MKIDLVVTDLDGTLWGHDWVVSQATKDALDALERRGVPVVAATARPSRGAKEVMRRNGIIVPHAILLNGALGMNLLTGERFHSVTFGIPRAAEIVRTFVSMSVEPCVYVDDRAYVVTSTTASSAPEYLEFVGDGLTLVEDVENFFADEDAFGVMGVGVAKQLLEPIVSSLEPLADVRFIPERKWGEWSLFAAPPAITKWAGVLAFCNRYGYSPDRVLAIGDADNDLDLLHAAAVSCALPESTPAVINAVDHVVAEWAEVLELID